MFNVPEANRITGGPLGSDANAGNNGAFSVPPEREALAPGIRTRLFIIASDGRGWEHVSVHAHEGRRSRTPTWDEMCLVKDLFWDPEDMVMQLHPRRSQYVNDHPHTLHLWRPIGRAIPEPIAMLVGRISHG